MNIRSKFSEHEIIKDVASILMRSQEEEVSSNLFYEPVWTGGWKQRVVYFTGSETLIHPAGAALRLFNNYVSARAQQCDEWLTRRDIISQLHFTFAGADLALSQIENAKHMRDFCHWLRCFRRHIAQFPLSVPGAILKNVQECKA